MGQITLQDRFAIPDLGSNTSRPQPKANTGSAFLNWLSDTSTSFVHLERRFDPFYRPLFDALLRDPIARVTTALINRKRPNEGFKIAEERPIPDEEAWGDSIIESFGKQMRLLWKPGGFEPVSYTHLDVYKRQVMR